MPRFTLRQLLFSMVPIAVGLCLILHVVYGPDDSDALNAIAQWLCGGAMIGGGLGSIYRHPIAGAAVGFAIQFVTLFLVGERFISFC